MILIDNFFFSAAKLVNFGPLHKNINKPDCQTIFSVQVISILTYFVSH